jgi:NADH dehydrogenase
VDRPLHVVTGAFGYSGRRIAARLLEGGVRVRTLTNTRPDADPFGGRVEAHPLGFDDPARLAASLHGAAVLTNTYWVRFNHRAFTFAQAVENSLRLFDAARAAGVGRVVHVSITNPSEDSPFEYFRGKARLERALRESGLPHTILRPAVLFGGGDILINNIAWALRRLPVFGVFGAGAYRLQPIHVDDFARLAVDEGRAAGNRVVQAIGPETFTFRGLAETLRGILGVSTPVVSVPPAIGYAAARVLGWFTGDVMLTWEEVGGLMADLLHVDAPPAGTTRLTDWARANADTLGARYAGELTRRGERPA